MRHWPGWLRLLRRLPYERLATIETLLYQTQRNPLSRVCTSCQLEAQDKRYRLSLSKNS